MTTKISRANSVKYYHKTTAPFKVKVVDARGNPVVGNVTFSINKKKYTRNINSNGIASLNIKLSQGSYKISYTFAKTSLYEKSSGSATLNIKTLGKCVNNGYWLFGYNMKNVNLDKLAKTSTKHIFLNFAALEKHGKSAVETFIADAKKKESLFTYGCRYSILVENGFLLQMVMVVINIPSSILKSMKLRNMLILKVLPGFIWII